MRWVSKCIPKQMRLQPLSEHVGTERRVSEVVRQRVPGHLIFWSQTSLVLRPTVSDHITAWHEKPSPGCSFKMLQKHFEKQTNKMQPSTYKSHAHCTNRCPVSIASSPLLATDFADTRHRICILSPDWEDSGFPERRPLFLCRWSAYWLYRTDNKRAMTASQKQNATLQRDYVFLSPF